jgi:hypothetical protein
VGEEIDERAGGRFYGIAVGIDSVRLDGSQVPGGKNADLAIKWRYRDPTRRITLDLPRSKTGKPASSTICCRPCTARATRCYSRGDVAHEPDLRSRHSGWAPLSRTRQCERQPLEDRRVWFGSRAAVVARLMVRPVCPQLRKCPVCPGSYAWCHDRTSSSVCFRHRSGDPSHKLDQVIVLALTSDSWGPDRRR